MPIAVTFRSGNTVRTMVDADRLTKYLDNLNMDDVTAIEYGDTTKSSQGLAQEIKPADVDLNFHGGSFYIDMMTPDNKRIAFVKMDPVKMQEFALRILQQTTYRFEDAANRLAELEK